MQIAGDDRRKFIRPTFGPEAGEHGHCAAQNALDQYQFTVVRGDTVIAVGTMGSGSVNRSTDGSMRTTELRAEVVRHCSVPSRPDLQVELARITRIAALGSVPA